MFECRRCIPKTFKIVPVASMHDAKHHLTGTGFSRTLNFTHLSKDKNIKKSDIVSTFTCDWRTLWKTDFQCSFSVF